MIIVSHDIHCLINLCISPIYTCTDGKKLHHRVCAAYQLGRGFGLVAPPENGKNRTKFKHAIII